MSIHKKLAVFIAVCTLAAGSFTLVSEAHAAALSGSQVQAILSLLSAFGADSSTIATVQAALSGTAPATEPASTSSGETTTSSGSSSGENNASVSGTDASSGAVGSRIPKCIVLDRTLSVGSTDGATNGEVTELQQFLSDNGFYEGPVTGFYGSLTLSAVQKFQAEAGTVSSGAPETTGYGQVGPSTRAAISSWCNRVSPAPQPATSSFTASPSSGSAPFMVTFRSSGLGVGTVQFGDGTSESLGALFGNSTNASAGYCGAAPDFSCSIPHTYATAGTYTAQLSNASGAVVASQVISVASAPSAAASATIDQSSLAATLGSAPTITGTASNLPNGNTVVSVIVESTDGVAEQGLHPAVVNGRWSATFQPLSLGTYVVKVEIALTDTVLTSGTLTVTLAPTAQPPSVSVYYPTAGSVFTNGSDVQLGFSSSDPLATFDVKLTGKGYAYDYGNVNPPEAGGKLHFTLPADALPSNYTSLAGFGFLIYYNGALVATSPTFTITAPAFSESKALSFITSLYDASHGLVREYPGGSTFWLWSDNLLAQAVLRHSNPSLASAIKAKMDSYGITMRSAWAVLDPTYASRTSFLGTQELTVPGTSDVKYSDYGLGGELGCNEYADIAFLKAIYDYKTGDKADALTCYNDGKAMWNGTGMVDKASSAGHYAVYKTALGLIAQMMTGYPAIGIPSDYFAQFQGSDGGIHTDLVNGQVSGLENVETSSAVLIAEDLGLLDNPYGTIAAPTTSATPTVSAPSTLPAPTGLSATCSSGGSFVTLSWNAVPGATYYKPRMTVPADSPYCAQAGWQLYSDHTTCYPNPDTYTKTTVASFPVALGTSYTWWVEGDTASTSGAITTASFTCKAGTGTYSNLSS